VSMVLDDFKYLQQRNHLKRILSTIFAFAIGIIICLIFARSTRAHKKDRERSQENSGRKLVKIRDSKRRDEIGVLSRASMRWLTSWPERKSWKNG